jgi:V/A-type H+-transporting ATPase subunit I
MLKPKQMSRLLIAGSRDQMAPVIAELYRHNLFHIEDYVDAGAEGYEGFKIGTPLSGASEKSADLIKIRAITSAVSLSADDVDKKPSCSMDELQTKIERELPLLEQEVEELTVRRSKLDAREKELEQKITELTPFAAIPVDLNLYHGYKRFTTIAGYLSRDVVITVPHEKQIVQGDKTFMVMVYPTEKKSEVEKTLQEAGFQSVPVPDESGSAQGRIEFYQGEIATVKTEIQAISTQLEDVKKKHAGFLAACEELLKAEVDQTEAPLRFATTRQTFVAEGWVPADKVTEVTNSLVHAAEGKIFVTVVPMDPEHDSVPVEYNNPDFAKPTEVLMDVYSRPGYTEVDPTLMISIVFPIFFGLILGDVGYGLILLVMAFGLRKFLKGEAAGQLLTVLRNASISSIFFGIIFSEFLGFPIPGWNPVLYSRHLMSEHGGHGPNIPELMVLSIWIGIAHLTLGRILGMYNHAKQDHGHHRTLAVMANFGWLAVMWGILIGIWSTVAMPLMPSLTGLPVVMAVPGTGFGINIGHLIAVVLLVAGIIFIARESVLEVIELPTIVSHVLSYARIVAVGLSSVAIAMVVNFMSITMFIEPQLENLSLVGVVIILVGVVVFVVGHALNTALGILGGGLHSIRLHYVEFFTKFYKGGGRKYVPFGMKRRFTEE